MPTVRITPITLRLSDRARLLVARLVQVEIERQALAGLTPDGTPRPPGKTKPVIDLHDTGRMFADSSISPQGITYHAGYAHHVEARYHFLGLSADAKKRVEALATEALRQETLGTK